jgi:hypothetical protein
VARSGAKAAEGEESVGAEEPLAEWEQELLTGGAADAAVEATGGDAAAADATPAAESTGAAGESTEAAQAADAASDEAAAPVAFAAVAGEFGEDSAAANEDGSAPEGFTIKGNKNSMKFHAESSPWYDRTVAEVWFRTVEAAEAAGFVNAEKPAED